MPQLNPYLTFDNNCVEAMNFYQSCFGGELSVQTIGQSPMKEEMPTETHNKVLHAHLKNDQIVIMASDMMMPGSQLVLGNNVALSLNYTNKQEMQEHFDKLSAGGEVTVPISETFWGSFGQVTDKYGIRWMLNIDAPKQNENIENVI